MHAVRGGRAHFDLIFWITYSSVSVALFVGYLLLLLSSFRPVCGGACLAYLLAWLPDFCLYCTDLIILHDIVRRKEATSYIKHAIPTDLSLFDMLEVTVSHLHCRS
jgi:hypothetical protein